MRFEWISLVLSAEEANMLSVGTRHTSQHGGDPVTVTACVSILGLKKFAAEKLNPQSALRNVLLAERDEIVAIDFLSRIPVWLILL
jgi:hypothetical protein